MDKSYELTINLTKDQAYTIMSRFKTSMWKLEASGDYPEKADDKEIADKLTSLWTDICMLERKEKRGP